MIFNGRLGLHVIEFPTGRFGYVGSIPRDCCRELPADRAAILGCRTVQNEAGELVEYRTLTFDTRAEAIAHATGCGHEVKG